MNCDCFAGCSDVSCCCNGGCGAPYGVSRIQTETPNRTQGVAASNGSANNTAGLINNLSILGMSIASAVTGRPLVNQKGVTTIGPKPLVTGQVQASTVLIVAGIALAGFLVYMGSRGSK